MSTSGIESADTTSNPEFNKLNKNNFGDSNVSVRKDQNKAETSAKTPGALPTKKTDLKRRNSMSELPTLKSQPKNKSDDETSKIELQKKVETPKESNKDSASPADGGAVTSKASNVSRKDKESPSAPGQIFFTAEEAKDKPNMSKYTIKLYGALAGDFSLGAKFSLTNSNEQESFYIYVDSTGKVIEGGKQYPAETQILVDEFLKKVKRSKDFLSPDPNLRREIGEDWYTGGTSVSKVVRKEEIIKENFFIDDSIAKKFFEKLQKKIRKNGSQKPQDQANKTEDKSKNQSNDLSSINADEEKILASVSESGNKSEPKHSQPVDDAKGKAVIPQSEESKNTENKTAEATKEGKNEKPEQKENPAKENSVNSEQEKNPVEKGNLNSEDTAAATKVKNSENSDKSERPEDDLEPKPDVDDETNAPKESEKIEASTSAETSRIHPEDKKADISFNEILCDYIDGANIPGKIKCKVSIARNGEGKLGVAIRHDGGSILVFSNENGDIDREGTLYDGPNSFEKVSGTNPSLNGKKLVKAIFEKEGQGIQEGLKQIKKFDFSSFFIKDLFIDESYIKDFFETEDTNGEGKGNNGKVGAENPENFGESDPANGNTEPKNGAGDGNNMPVNSNEGETLSSSTDEPNVTEKPNDLPEDAKVVSASDEIVHDLDGNGDDQDKVKCPVSISNWGDDRFAVSIKAGTQGNIDIFVDSNHEVKEVRYASRSNGIPLETIKQTSAAQELVNKIFGKISDINSLKDVSSLNFGDSSKEEVFAIKKSDIEGVIEPKNATAAEDVSVEQVAEGQALGNKTNVKPLNFSELCEAAKINGSILLRPRDTVGARIRNFFFNIFMGLAALFNGERRFKSNKKTADKAKSALKSILDDIPKISVTDGTFFSVDVKDTPRDGNCMLWSALISAYDPSKITSNLNEARNLAIPYLRSRVAEEIGIRDDAKGREGESLRRADKLRRRVGVGAKSIEPVEMGPVAEALGRDIVIISDPDGKGSQLGMILHPADKEKKAINSQNGPLPADDARRMMEALNSGIVIYATKGHARAVNISNLQYEINNSSDNNPSNETLNEASKPTNETPEVNDPDAENFDEF